MVPSLIAGKFKIKHGSSMWNQAYPVQWSLRKSICWVHSINFSIVQNGHLGWVDHNPNQHILLWSFKIINLGPCCLLFYSIVIIIFQYFLPLKLQSWVCGFEIYIYIYIITSMLSKRVQVDACLIFPVIRWNARKFIHKNTHKQFIWLYFFINYYFLTPFPFSFETNFLLVC